MTDRTVSAVREPAVVTIPAGDFLMGSEDAKANERPERAVSKNRSLPPVFLNVSSVLFLDVQLPGLTHVVKDIAKLN